MNNPEKVLVKKEVLTLEGISQYYINVKHHKWKYDVLTDIYNTINISQCIIYINSKARLQDIYHELMNSDFPVGMIHGNLETRERETIMNKFRQGDIRILLSTDLLSRGIDVQLLSLVINYDLPIQKETYIHRIGRSGRYGRKGVAINFITDRDLQDLSELQSFYNTNIVKSWSSDFEISYRHNLDSSEHILISNLNPNLSSTKNLIKNYEEKIITKKVKIELEDNEVENERDVSKDVPDGQKTLF